MDVILKLCSCYLKKGHRADVNKRDNNGLTPRDIAKRGGFIEIVNLLDEANPRNDTTFVLNETSRLF